MWIKVLFKVSIAHNSRLDLLYIIIFSGFAYSGVSVRWTCDAVKNRHSVHLGEDISYIMFLSLKFHEDFCLLVCDSI